MAKVKITDIGPTTFEELKVAGAYDRPPSQFTLLAQILEDRAALFDKTYWKKGPFRQAGILYESSNELREVAKALRGYDEFMRPKALREVDEV